MKHHGGSMAEKRESGDLQLKHRLKTEHANLNTDRAATAEALASPQAESLAAPPKFPSTWSKQSHTRPQPEGAAEQRKAKELVPSKSASNLNVDGKVKFAVGSGDAVRKKLLFRAGDTSDPQSRGDD